MSDIAQRIAKLPPEKLEQLLRETQHHARKAAEASRIGRRTDPDAPGRLSSLQQRLWFLDQLDPGTPIYTMHGAYRWRGALDTQALEASFAEVARRHEVLRSVFRQVGGVARQVLGEGPAIDFEVDALGADGEARLAHRVAQEARWSFSLSEGPLVRVAALKLAEDDWVVSIALHHIVADGWSIGILMRELAAAYEARLAGRQLALPELPVQMADFAEWQHQQLTDEALGAHLEFWRQQLADAPPRLELTTDYTRPAKRSSRGAICQLRLADDLKQGLLRCGGDLGATLYMTLLAAYQILLWRYSGEEEVVVGSPVAGRPAVEVEGLIGPFTNTVVRRSSLAGDPTFIELLARIREATLAADAHTAMPLEKLVEAFAPERTANYSPIFQVWFVLHNTPPASLELPGVLLEPLPAHSGTTRFDLTLSLVETGEGIDGFVEYSTDLFEGATIEGFCEQFRILCQEIVKDPSRPISRLPLMTPARRREILQQGTGDARVPRPWKDFNEGLAAAARINPTATAVACGDEQLSWEELDRLTNQIAHHLQSMGVEPGTIVGFCLPRSLDLLLAVVGIIKAGGACLPLDPKHPQERLEHMLEESEAEVLITLDELLYELPAQAAACGLLCMDSDRQAIEEAAVEPPSSSVGEDDPAYVIYTSGSTGPPKGVVVARGPALDHFAAARRVFGISQEDRVLQFASLSFDAAFEQVFTALLSGASLVLRDGEEAWSLGELDARIRDLELTVVNLPTGYWQQWAETAAASGGAAPGRLRLVIAGGDIMAPRAVRHWYDSPLAGVRLLNAYGPTESIITATVYEVPAPAGRDGERRVPIGSPLPGRTVRLLDRHGQPVPGGVAGEIHPADPFLAIGYLHRDEATAAAFIDDPHEPDEGSRLYRSGDLGRYRADGALEFLGRRDHQVKVRGYRIELGEIEEALLRYRKVREAVVVVDGEEADTKSVVAYLVPVRQDEAPQGAELREFLQDELPRASIPSQYVVLEELPRTVGGKVDRARLPRAHASEAGEAAAVEDDGHPLNATEVAVATIFCDVLGRQQVLRHDNFFDLGGHSLLGTQLISRFSQELGVDLSLQSLFAEPTVAGLTALVEQKRQEQGQRIPPIVALPRDANLSLSFAQQRLWLFEQMTPGTAAYTMAAALELRGQLDVGALERSFQALLDRHEVLRTTFGTRGDGPVQTIAEKAPLEIEVCDLSSLSATAWQDEVPRQARAEALKPFDLETGPLLRLKLLRHGEATSVLLLTMHHIISDGWSIGVMVREVAALYESFVGGEAATLPELPVQYADYAVWQRQQLSGETLEGQLEYWRRQLEDLPTLEVPGDHPRPEVMTYQGGFCSFRLDAELSAALRQMSGQEGVTLFMTLLAAWQALLFRHSGQDDVVLGTAFTNRNRPEIEPLIGFFVNMLVLRTSLAGNPSWRELIRRARDTALGAYAHQELPFDHLVEALQPGCQRSSTALFQVVFVLQNGHMPALELPGLEIHPLPMQNGVTPYDLVLEVFDGDEEISGFLGYSTDIFEAATAERLLADLKAMLQAMVDEPLARVLDLPLDQPEEAPAVDARTLYGTTDFDFGEGG